MRILIVEDDPTLADGLRRSITALGHQAELAGDGQAALACVQQLRCDLLILDLGLPGIDGFGVLRQLRARGNRVPVLILTARDGLDDRVRGLDLGADDYLTKPFALPELEARVRALLRRAGGHAPTLSCGDLHYEPATRTVTVRGEVLALSARELGVLEALLPCTGRVVTKTQLFDRLYGIDTEASANAIEVCVHRLRRRLEGSGATIRTVRGLGYMIDRDDGE